MKAVVARVARTVPLTLEEVDISTDPELEARYGLDIPVLMMEGRLVAKHRVTDAALARAIQSRTTGPSDSREPPGAS
jgi:hypothetical protein